MKDHLEVLKEAHKEIEKICEQPPHTLRSGYNACLSCSVSSLCKLLLKHQTLTTAIKDLKYVEKKKIASDLAYPCGNCQVNMTYNTCADMVNEGIKKLKELI